MIRSIFKVTDTVNIYNFGCCLEEEIHDGTVWNGQPNSPTLAITQIHLFLLLLLLLLSFGCCWRCCLFFFNTLKLLPLQETWSPYPSKATAVTAATRAAPPNSLCTVLTVCAQCSCVSVWLPVFEVFNFQRVWCVHLFTSDGYCWAH